ncbi:hypothetical protein FGG08_003176 [Glutinoglossum americanum]|uniref:Altered inheritance of mitochondria protein 32 n=1 Tax=Glutinoglossum americanum TaxID=1670608 RepID=A0A9P8HYU2_9PEZI|nr:hypothetical protein FGG08_003176 [Glutinoglossum americanum]
MDVNIPKGLGEEGMKEERDTARACAEVNTPGVHYIDHERPLSNTMAAYVQQVLISTGKDDWTSRIEEDEEAGELVRGLRRLLGKGGALADPYNNIMLSHCSFSPSPVPTQKFKTASAYILPSFHYLPSIPLTPPSIEEFTRAFLLPPTLHLAHKGLLASQRLAFVQQPELQCSCLGSRSASDILILICGHRGRDKRCGVMGPLLRDEFERRLSSIGVFEVLKDAPPAETPPCIPAAKLGVRVGLISHVGGHKFAGNVIIYIPPSLTANDLAGKGIWYGRVEPRHVEGIIEETIVKGRVIGELFRGGIDKESQILRM